MGSSKYRLCGRNTYRAPNPETPWRPRSTVTLPDDVFERVREQAQGEGVTVGEPAVEAVQSHLAHRTPERLKRQRETRRRGMTEEEVESLVEKAVHESRSEER